MAINDLVIAKFRFVENFVCVGAVGYVIISTSHISGPEEIPLVSFKNSLTPSVEDCNLNFIELVKNRKPDIVYAVVIWSETVRDEERE